MFTRKGFTLVELMIVVAIIGILAAIAIPNFTSMQHRSKRAEVPSNVDGIKTAQIAYDAAYDDFVTVSTLMPDSSPGKQQRPWLTGSGFDTLGWSPDGEVRGSYITKGNNTQMKVQGTCDVDGDGSRATYEATLDSNNEMLTAQDVY